MRKRGQLGVGSGQKAAQISVSQHPRAKRQIAIGNDTDQKLVLIIVHHWYGPHIFASHYARCLTDGVGRQATNRIVGHDFPAIHRNLPDFERPVKELTVRPCQQPSDQSYY